MTPTGPRTTSRPPRAEVRARLLEAAATLFARRGVHATTLDDVARAAGFSKGAVYSNFDSKSDLVITLLTQETESALGALEAMMLPGTPLHELPDAVRDAFAPHEQVTADDFALMSEFRTQALADEAVLAAFVDRRRAVLERLTALVDVVFEGRPVDVTGLSAEMLARVLIDVALGSAFDAPATGDVGPGEVMGALLGALTRTR